MSGKCRHVISMESAKHLCDAVHRHHRGELNGLGCIQWSTCSRCGAYRVKNRRLWRLSPAP